jgi:maleate cis-trans isomerase
LRAAAPSEVTLIGAQVYVSGRTREAVERCYLGGLEDALERLRLKLPSQRWDDLDVVVQMGFPVGFLGGRRGLRQVEQRMRRATGRPVVVNAGAIVAAIRALSGRRLALASPYQEELNQLTRAGLESHGFTVAGLETLPSAAAQNWHQMSSGQVYDYLASALRHTPDADVLVVASGVLPTLGLLDRLEADFRVPLVTANQAALWNALRLAGIHWALPGLGRLFQLPTSIPSPLAGEPG